MSPNLSTEAPKPGTATLSQLLAAHPDASVQIYRWAIGALVQWQGQHAIGQPEVLNAKTLTESMECFVNGYLVDQRGFMVDEAQRKILDAAFAVVAAQCLELPHIAVHGQFTLDVLQMNVESLSATTTWPDLVAHIAVPATARSGPIGYDIVSLVRDPLRPWDEDVTLDITIRYWDLARKAGLPVGSDFGEFYRGMEWVAVLRQLSEPAPKSTADRHAWIKFLHSACARYRELRPLSRLIEHAEGIEAASGYAFGRM